ncbi:MAG: PD40 domain-containing protein [Flavobacteriales bacterium]|nr:PD40 domain-containing protein [Flavobacteriales bacterium]MCB9167974.1 PD40 domain-containing protein [Flavobacteriales bacterium]
MSILRTLSVFGLVSVALVSQAQMRDYTTKDKKAIKLYETGLEGMHIRKWDAAESDLRKAAGFDAHFVEPRFALAELYDMQGKDADAMKWYREALQLAPRFFPNAYLHLADIEFRNQEFSSAEQHYKAYLDLEDEPVRRARAKLGVDNCTFAERAIKQPVPFEPKNLGPLVNSPYGEYYPCVTADDATLLFTRDVPDDRSPWGHQEDFYVSTRGTDGNWTEAHPVPGVTTAANEGAGTLSPDGRFIIFTACAGVDGDYGSGRKGMGSCDLFISRRIGDRFGPPENLGPPVNSRNWESQPSLGSDGRTLYFVRGQQAQDGIKSMDIYVSSLQEDGTFSRPEKLPETINTPFQEESVQIHPDGRTLYFSSDGHPGFGGSDIYVSRRQDDGTWGPALNLGWPINTGGNENSLLVSADGRIAYFASDRPGGQGDLDLYSFELYPEARPQPVSYIKGRVSDKDTGKPIEADVMLYDLKEQRLATAAYSDPTTGEFLVCLPTERAYALNAGAEGYLFFSRNYDITGSGTAIRPYVLNIPMSPLQSGGSISLRNVFFASASAELLPESHLELDKVVRLLFVNPTVRLEVAGHTDDVGGEQDNLDLSQRRAAAVRDYLIAKGVAADRLEARGYGETKPIAPNDSEEGRAQNRRTEVKVL